MSDHTFDASDWLAVALCSAHHRWVDGHIAEAREVGLIVDSWEVDR